MRKKDAKEIGRYALALLAGFILFPIIVLILLVIASIASVPVAIIDYAGITNNNPILVGIGIAIVFVVVGIGVWIVYIILKRVVDLVWQG